MSGHSVRDLAAELLAADQPGFPAELVATRMVDLIGGDVSSVVECDLLAGSARRLGYAPADLPGHLIADPFGYLTRHPGTRHHRARASLAPVRVSDVVDPREWRRSPTYAELSGSMKMRHELIVPLATSAGVYTALGILRASQDFRDAERELAARMQPLLIGLYTLAARARTNAAGRPWPACPLTRRELEVLQAAAGGLTTHAVASRLGISPHTAARHIESVYAKLGTHDRVSTVLRAQRLGLIS